MKPTLLGLLLVLLLAGCASSRINAPWSDPQFRGQPPRGAQVWVVCQAADPTLRRICADRLAAGLAPLGGAGPAETGWAVTASLTDVASGRMMWSARASAPPSPDLCRQLSTLAALLLDAARQAGQFAG